MDLQQVIEELAGVDPAEVDEAARLALIDGVRRLVGRRALLGAAPASGSEAPWPCCEHAAGAPRADATPAPGAPPEPDAEPCATELRDRRLDARRALERLAPHHPSLRRRRPALSLVPGPA